MLLPRKDVAQQRNSIRPPATCVPSYALTRMARLLEPPDPSRYPWEAATLVLQQGTQAEGAAAAAAGGGAVRAGLEQGCSCLLISNHMLVWF